MVCAKAWRIFPKTVISLQSVIPNVTESYTCGQDCGDSDDFGDVPYCVLKSFPYAQEHAGKFTQSPQPAVLISAFGQLSTFIHQHYPDCEANML